MREFARGLLADCFPRATGATTDRSVLALRNALAQGGGMSAAEANRLLAGDGADGG